MVMNGLDGSGIGERKRDLNISCTVGHHSGSKSLSEAGKFSEETAVIRVKLQRLHADAFDEIGRIRFSNYFAQGLFRTSADSQLDTTPGSEGNNFFCCLLIRGYIRRHNGIS